MGIYTNNKIKTNGQYCQFSFVLYLFMLLLMCSPDLTKIH